MMTSGFADEECEVESMAYERYRLSNKRLGLTLMCGLLIALPATAQFSSDVPLVRIDVKPLDSEDRPIPNLPPASFALFDDGRPQRLIDVTKSDDPISLGILLERETTCPLSWEQSKSAVLTLMNGLLPQDQIYLAALGQPDMTRFSARSGNEFLSAAMDGLRFHQNIPAIEGVKFAVQWLSKNAGEKRLVLVLITDEKHQKETVSSAAMQEMITAGGAIYMIAMGAPSRQKPFRKPAGIVQLVDSTGGIVYTPDFTYGSSDDAARRLAREVHAGYNLLYEPPEGLDGKYHEVRVQVASAKVAKTRARKGYYGFQRTMSSIDACDKLRRLCFDEPSTHVADAAIAVTNIAVEHAVSSRPIPGGPHL
jgi:VWFA-related protein